MTLKNFLKVFFKFIVAKLAQNSPTMEYKHFRRHAHLHPFKFIPRAKSTGNELQTLVNNFSNSSTGTGLPNR